MVYPDLGPCCACGVKSQVLVRNIMLLDKKAPVSGTGSWGCFQCGLPLEGAIAVLCDVCLDTGREIEEACVGPPGDGRRVPVEQLTGHHQHDMSKHPEADFEQEDVNHAGRSGG